jgi:hypothetical protein
LIQFLLPHQHEVLRLARALGPRLFALHVGHQSIYPVEGIRFTE